MTAEDLRGAMVRPEDLVIDQVGAELQPEDLAAAELLAIDQVGAELQPEDLAAAAAAAGWPAIGSRRRAASWHFPY